MAGLIDNEATTGLAYTVNTGLQWTSEVGGGGLILNPGEQGTGYIQLETTGYILLEDGVSFILLQ